MTNHVSLVVFEPYGSFQVGNLLNSSSASVGVVVPTLGNRLNFLHECLESIRLAGTAYVAIVAPKAKLDTLQLRSDLFNQILEDPSKGLSAAIDLGIQSLPLTVQYVTWLGDDDVLTSGSLDFCAEHLERNAKTSLIYGSCGYMDEHGDALFMNKSGRFASKLMQFGPQLVPQPGCLFRREAYAGCGGLDHSLKWAFDLDLFIRLSRHGNLDFVPRHVANFRWHGGSLTVGSRIGSVREASEVRMRYYRFASWFPINLWESLLRRIIFVAGLYLTSRSKRRQMTSLKR